MFEKALEKIEKRIDKVAVEVRQPVSFKEMLVTNPTLATSLARLVTISPLVAFVWGNQRKFPTNTVGALVNYTIMLEHKKPPVVGLVFEKVFIELEGNKISLWFNTILYSFVLDKRLIDSYQLMGFDFSMFNENKLGQFIVEVEKLIYGDK